MASSATTELVISALAQTVHIIGRRVAGSSLEEVQVPPPVIGTSGAFFHVVIADAGISPGGHESGRWVPR
jgi:hypothetical protein